MKRWRPVLLIQSDDARKINVNGETMIVGSDFFIATPIWMKAERTGTWQRNQPG
jgi:hypothetical protein